MTSNHKPPNLGELGEAKLTAYALGQLDGQELAEVESLLLRSDHARQFVQETTHWAAQVREAYRASPLPEPSPTLRDAIETELQKTPSSQPRSRTMSTPTKPKRTFRSYLLGLSIVGCVALVSTVLLMPALRSGRETASTSTNLPAQINEAAKTAEVPSEAAPNTQIKLENPEKIAQFVDEFNRQIDEQRYAEAQVTAKKAVELYPTEPTLQQMNLMAKFIHREKLDKSLSNPNEQGGVNELSSGEGSNMPYNSNKPYVMPDAKQWEKLSMSRKDTPTRHRYEAKPADAPASSPERQQQEPLYTICKPVYEMGNKPADDANRIAGPGNPVGILELAGESESNTRSDELVQLGKSTLQFHGLQVEERSHRPFADMEPLRYPDADFWRRIRDAEGKPAQNNAPNTEQYDPIQDNAFLPVAKEPLSTFSIDVDTASYANVRRFLRESRLPPPDAVRIEEMVNYFSYNYSPPTDGTPFSVNMETAQCPWKQEHRLLRIGLKGREIDRKNRGASNLVFLLDVSGSMNEADKLPLVKEAMKMLVGQLQEDDRVAIVTYASETRVALPSARGNERERITAAIDALNAGGSTYGSGGIQLAYQQAAEHFVTGGVNRVILCTDGDLNVGITRDEDLVELIQEKAKSGVFLTVLGFGQGNLKDSKMQKLADRGNGIYAYIDCLREARKILVEQMTGSLVTIAKDVKIQIEFNPAVVQAYRLVGYEKRLLANQDFSDDKKDAGEIGAGHTVTALYELVPASSSESDAAAEPGLKYQRVPQEKLTPQANSGELLTLRLRYKEPEQNTSKLLEFTTKDAGKPFSQATPDFRFAASVAAFGMMLRSSPYRGNLNYAAVAEFAAGALDNDPNGYRAEYLDLIRAAAKLSAAAPQ